MVMVFQIMDGTDNMMFVTKMWDCGDTEMHECVVQTMVSVVSSCFEHSVHRRDSLDARVMDRLCTANAPTIIVSELKNRRVTSIGKPQNMFQDIIKWNPLAATVTIPLASISAVNNPQFFSHTPNLFGDLPVYLCVVCGKSVHYQSSIFILALVQMRRNWSWPCVSFVRDPMSATT